MRGEEGSSNDGSKKDEEEWPLKEVVFLEDVRSVPLGEYLQISENKFVITFQLFLQFQTLNAVLSLS